MEQSNNENNNPVSQGPSDSALLIAFICAILSLQIFPIPFALVGIVIGIKRMNANHELSGILLMLFSGICGALGFYFGYYGISFFR